MKSHEQILKAEVERLRSELRQKTRPILFRQTWQGILKCAEPGSEMGSVYDSRASVLLGYGSNKLIGILRRDYYRDRDTGAETCEPHIELIP